MHALPIGFAFECFKFEQLPPLLHDCCVAAALDYRRHRARRHRCHRHHRRPQPQVAIGRSGDAVKSAGAHQTLESKHAVAINTAATAAVIAIAALIVIDRVKEDSGPIISARI